MLTGVRRALSGILSVATVVGALALDDTTLVLPVLALALVVLPLRLERRPKRRMRAADWVVLAFTLAALALTLLMADGVLRWTVIAGIFVAYLVSWPVLGRADRDHELHRTVNDGP